MKESTLFSLTQQALLSDLKDQTSGNRGIAAKALIESFGKRYIGQRDTPATNLDRICYDTFAKANNRAFEQGSLIRNGLLGKNDLLSIVMNEAQKIAYAVISDCLDDNDYIWYNSTGQALLPVGGFCMNPGVCAGYLIGTHHHYKSPLLKYRKGGLLVSSSRNGLSRVRFVTKSHRAYAHLNGELAVSCVTAATFVPKSYKTSRLIAPQHNGDLLLQYPAEAFLREALLRRFSINLETQQETNREMARLGSIHTDPLSRHAYSTIDLSSASDLISRELVRWLVPGVFFEYLDSCRSQNLQSEFGNVELSMMATMGNAYCFPLMTFVFSCIISALYSVCGLKGYRWSVFGDDLIVHQSTYDMLCEVLEGLRMVPNMDKSFKDGLFRESCGADFYNGYDVRPVFFERLAEAPDIYSLANRLARWGFKHSIPLPNTLTLLLGAVEPSDRTVCPLWEADTCGFQIPYHIMGFIPKFWRNAVKCVIRRGSPHVDDLMWDTRSVYSLIHYKGFQRVTPKLKRWRQDQFLSLHALAGVGCLYTSKGDLECLVPDPYDKGEGKWGRMDLSTVTWDGDALALTGNIRPQAARSVLKNYATYLISTVHLDG